MSNREKKYFIKDVELTSLDEDKLNYKDIVKNLELIIDSTETPFNIAITGKSGSGKSSIVNFLATKYEMDSEKYSVDKVNVWKENVSIKNYLEHKFGNANDTMGNSKLEDEIHTEHTEFIDNEYSNLKNNTVENNKKKNNSKALRIIVAICNAILTFVACFFFTSIVFVIMEYFENRSIYRASDIFFVENTYINYSENLGFIMLFSLVLAGIVGIVYNLFIKKDKKEEAVKFNDNNYPETRNVITPINVEESQTNKKKNIVIIEDIDKLSVSKIVKILEEIKYFNKYENCIFIVPFEKSVLKKVIEIRNTIKFSPKYKPLKFEKVLDKIFQFQICIPQISNKELKEYAVSLVEKNIPDFIYEYCDSEVLESVIRNVLIYKNVATPRHVKKLINNFVNYKLLVLAKISDGYIDENIIDANDFDFQIAKLSVLQLDFEDFYDLVLEDYTYLDKILELYSLDEEELIIKYDDIEEELKPFVKSKYRALKNFLIQTQNYSCDQLINIISKIEDTQDDLYEEMKIENYIIEDDDISNWSREQVLENIKLMNNGYSQIDVHGNTLIDLLNRLEETITYENYQDTFEIIKDNSDCFFEENESISAYVQFLVDYIHLSPNPDEVIAELDENFMKIGKLCELNKNIKGLENFDYDKAYEFMAKCIDNYDLYKATYIIDSILSDENSVKDCLNIETKMKNHNLVDVIECNVDYIIEAENSKYNINIEDENDVKEEDINLNANNDIENNYILLKNLLELCVIKQIYLNQTDVLKILEKTLNNREDVEYILSVYSILNKLDKMYFYEIRKDFNELIYENFHMSEDDSIKNAVIECVQHFKNTHLFKTKLTESEAVFYNEISSKL